MKPMLIGKTVYKVADFLSWQRAGSLELSPLFQRRPVWPPAAKSYLIDTIVRGLPIPIVFIRERTDLSTLEPRREVVDGQQRLRTLISFMEPAALADYDERRDSFAVKPSHNKEIAGKTFRQLPTEVQKRLLNYEFSVHTLSSDTDDRDVLQIFARLNSTGLKVNPQEIRNALFIGEFKAAMYELAHEQLSRWRQWGVFDETAIARMQEVEATSEFALLMLRGLQGKTQRAISRMYKDKEESFPEGEEIARRFRKGMDAIDEVIGDRLRTLPLSRVAIFYTVFALFYDLMYELNSPLRRAAAKDLPTNLSAGLLRASDVIAAGDFEEPLAKALRGATSDRGSREVRLEFLRQMCSGSTA